MERLLMRKLLAIIGLLLLVANGSARADWFWSLGGGGGGGGGSGTVGNCATADSIAAYSSIGTTVGCLPSVGLAGQALTSNGPGLLPTWQNVAGSGTVNSGTAGGQLAYYQTATNAVFGNTNANISNGTLTLGTANTTLGSIVLEGSTSGAATLRPPAVAGTPTLTLPTASGTVPISVAGDGTVVNGSAATPSAAGAISLSLANAGAGTVLGNRTGASAAPSYTSQPVLGVNGGTGGQVTLNGSTSGSVQVSVAAAAGTGTVFQLPSSNGTNGQVLQTDGAGVTSWVNGGAAASFTPGTTAIIGATAPCLLANTSGTTSGCEALGPNFALVSNTLQGIIPDSTHTISATVANAGGQDNFNGSSITATGIALPANNSTQSIVNFNASTLTINNNGVTVNGLPLSTSLHMSGFYNYTLNPSSGQWDAWGFPGFGTITTNALTKFTDGTGAATASGVTDDGTTVSTAENVTVTGTTTDLTGTNTKVAQVEGQSNVQSGTTYTTVASDCGKTLIFTSNSAVTVTLAASVVPASGTTCIMTVIQAGTAKVSVNGSAVSAATLVSANSFTGTSGTAGSVISLTQTTVSSVATAYLTGNGS